MKRILIFALALTMVISTASCKKDTENPNPDESPSIMPSPSPTETISPQPTDPGDEPIDDPQDPVVKAPVFYMPQAGTRPIAIVMDNQGDRAFPQAGIASAQIVYEMVVEGGITRYVALFWENEANLIGPVRSARHYMLDFILPFDAIFVHTGGSPQAKSDIQSLNIESVDSLGKAGYIYEKLTNEPNNWQDTFTYMYKINSYISGYRISTTSSNVYIPPYSQTFKVPDKGINANTIMLTYSGSSYCGYIYDSDKEKYFRNRNGKTHTDRDLDMPFGVTNIIIQKVENKTIPGDTEGRQNLTTVGEGTGYFISGGKAVDIVWKKANRNAPTRYYDKDGKEIIFNPGNTWIQVMPLSAEIIIL